MAWCNRLCVQQTAMFFFGLVFFTVSILILYQTVESIIGNTDYCNPAIDIPARIVLFVFSFVTAAYCGFIPYPEDYRPSDCIEPFYVWKFWTWLTELERCSGCCTWEQAGAGLYAYNVRNYSTLDNNLDVNGETSANVKNRGEYCLPGDGNVTVRTEYVGAHGKSGHIGIALYSRNPVALDSDSPVDEPGRFSERVNHPQVPWSQLKKNMETYTVVGGQNRGNCFASHNGRIAEMPKSANCEHTRFKESKFKEPVIKYSARPFGFPNQTKKQSNFEDGATSRKKESPDDEDFSKRRTDTNCDSDIFYFDEDDI